MADRTGLCGAGLMELESRHNSTMTCPIKSREGIKTLFYRAKTKYPFIGTFGMVCTVGAVHKFSQIENLCQPCSFHNHYMDGPYDSLYGFSEKTMRRLSTRTGYHSQRDTHPRISITYQNEQTRSYGFLPAHVHPDLQKDPNGKIKVELELFVISNQKEFQRNLPLPH